MASEIELTKIRDEVFRKIGRNLLNFQKIELMLKHIIANGRISGYMSEIKENHQRRISSVHKQTMGNLVGQFIENTFIGLEKSAEPTTDRKEPYLSFSFNVEADADFYESKKQALKSLVDDRNDLIHHLLPRFNPDSIESCLEIKNYLDQQRERLIPEYDHLQSLILNFEEIKKEYVEFLNSAEGKKQIEVQFLQQSSLVALLIDISIQHCRPDGWTLLNVAGQHARLILPEEIGKLKIKYGYKTLKELVLATELFDIAEEPTERGGVRVLYRSKPELGYSAFRRLMESVLDTSNKTASDGGWTLISTASQQIENFFAEDFALVKEVWQRQSLKELIVESELFDIFDEPFNNGQVRELYRPKTDLSQL